MATAPDKIHIESSPEVCGGKPRIAGSRVRVQDVVAWTEAGQSPDEIVCSFPHLTLADVYAALAYYHDHREAIDHQIRQDDTFVAALKVTSGTGLLARARSDDSR
ncbi:MAG: DUF433 domain-containing protein [Planctomycetota bacterium]